MGIQCAFYIGANTAYNIRRLLQNLGSMLSGTVDLDLIVTDNEPLSPAIRDQFGVYTDGGSDNIHGEYRALQQYLSETTPDVITQLTEPPSHGTITGILARRHDIPWVYRYSGDRFGVYRTYSGFEKLAYYGYNNLLGRVPLELANQFITLGSMGRRRLIQRCVAAKDIKVLPPAIEADRFSPDREPVKIPGVMSDQSVVLFVGRLSRHKGIKRLEKVMPAVLRERPDIHFVFVGDPQSPPSVPRDNDENVTVVGRIPPERMPHYYTRADIVVLPSLTEGLPLVLIESLLSGTPVIASPVGDIPDITNNTCRTDAELREMLCSYEELPLDDGSAYTCEALAPKYEEFYRQFG